MAKDVCAKCGLPIQSLADLHIDIDPETGEVTNTHSDTVGCPEVRAT